MDAPAALRLEAGAAAARVLPYGARLAALSFGGTDVVLAYPDDADHRDDEPYLGSVLGRTSGRIKAASLVLDQTTHRLTANEGEDHLHGGTLGFGRRTWDVEAADARSATLRHSSPDGEEGYPGRLDASCRFDLEPDRLTITYEAEADAPTPVSLTHHPYFALGGGVSAHRLTVNASGWLPLTARGVPTRERRDVTGGPLDLRAGRSLADLLADLDGPLDHCLVCEGGVEVLLEGPAGALRLAADQPCLQVYGAGKMGAPFGPGAGLALEPQAYPDAERCGFPSRLLRPGETYRRTTVVAWLGAA